MSGFSPFFAPFFILLIRCLKWVIAPWHLPLPVPSIHLSAFQAAFSQLPHSISILSFSNRFSASNHFHFQSMVLRSPFLYPTLAYFDALLPQALSHSSSSFVLFSIVFLFPCFLQTVLLSPLLISSFISKLLPFILYSRIWTIASTRPFALLSSLVSAIFTQFSTEMAVEGLNFARSHSNFSRRGVFLPFTCVYAAFPAQFVAGNSIFCALFAD